MSEERDNPSKNFALTLYLKEFPKDGDKEPTLADWDEAFHELTTPEVVEALKLNAFVGQAERGEGGTPHGQAYAQTIDRTRRATFAKRIAKHTKFTAHVSNAGGSAADNVAYCTKPTGPWKYASGAVKHSTTLSRAPVWVGKDRLVKKGQRSDIQTAIRAIENGATLREIDQRFPSVGLRYGRQLGAMKFRKDAQEKKAERLGHLFILHGPAGTGKSWMARHKITAELGLSPADVYSPNLDGSQVWFDGYNGEKVLLIDDYECGNIKRGQLLRMTDIYAYHAAIKGGHVVAAWDYVIITSNQHISELFGELEIDYDEDGKRIEIWRTWPAMYSRIDYAIDFTGMPDKRAELKAYTSARMVDLAGSVAPLLPATLAHGTGEASAEGQCGVRGSIPRPVDADETDDSTSAQNANFGTKSDEGVGSSA